MTPGSTGGADRQHPEAELEHIVPLLKPWQFV